MKIRIVVKIGDRYGRLLVIKEPFVVEKTNKKNGRRLSARYAECRCDCGTIKIIKCAKLTAQDTRSCGCLARELSSKRAKTQASLNTTTHGHTVGGKSRTYSTWCSMLNRCYNKNVQRYPAYGGRGISVESSWHKFENFLADMGEKPEGLTLERIDVNKDYCKENCCWATWEEQYKNTRSIVFVTHQGKTLTLSEWAKELGFPKKMLEHRHARGDRGAHLLRPRYTR